MKRILSYSIILLAIIFSSCDDDGAEELSKLELLTSKTWTVTETDISIAGLPTTFLPDSLQELAETLDFTGSQVQFDASNNFGILLPSGDGIEGTFECSDDEQSITLTLNDELDALGSSLTFDIDELTGVKFEMTSEDTITVTGVGDIPYSITLKMT